MDNGRIMKELKELQEGVKNVSIPIASTVYKIKINQIKY